MIRCKIEDKVDEVRRLHDLGLGNRKVAKILNVPRSSLKYLCDKYGIKPQERTINYLNMSQFQQEVFIGTMLGDGSISNKGTFNIGHSIKQKEYFNHKVEVFNQFGFLLYKRSNIHKKTGKEYISLQAYSKKFKELYEYRSLFYNENSKKLISKDILINFTEVSLAYLFMDDGNSQQYNTTIALCDYDNVSINNFRVFLLEKWNIETTVTKQKSVRIRQKSINIFFDLIRKYIHESMLYKIKSSINSVNSGEACEGNPDPSCMETCKRSND